MPMIAIVDDDPSLRRALHRLLRSAGYVVEGFASACEFLASGPSGRTACLVLDIRLGGMTGFELQERLAADRAPFPVIFMTAHDDAPTRARVQRAGVAGYLPKPFDAALLLSTIQGAVSAA